MLDGLDDEPAERWSFRDIIPDFRWLGEVSSDNRATWRVDKQMLIRRRS